MNYQESIKILGSLDSGGVTPIPRLFSIDFTGHSQELLREGQEIRKRIPPDPGLEKENNPHCRKDMKPHQIFNS